ncbi:MAG: hypothetical protein V4662_21580 [Verrucomicrobiota bacterium]
MIWRLLSALVVLFWAVMTGLIIRDTYFPDHSRFAEVPVRMVFDLFLSEAAAFNNTLHVYQGMEKLGHTSFALRRMDSGLETDSKPLYALVANGSLQLPGQDAKVDIGYQVNGELLEAEHWKSFDVRVTAPDSQMEAEIIWKEGDKLPKIEIKKGGQVIMNTAMLQTLIDNPGASGWLTQMLPKNLTMDMKSLPQASAANLQAREGRLDLAGKQRRCYIVTASLMPGYDAKLYFSELGELARVELPGGYRLLEPMMHGLEPGMSTYDE